MSLHYLQIVRSRKEQIYTGVKDAIEEILLLCDKMQLLEIRNTNIPSTDTALRA